MVSRLLYGHFFVLFHPAVLPGFSLFLCIRASLLTVWTDSLSLFLSPALHCMLMKLAQNNDCCNDKQCPHNQIGQIDYKPDSEILESITDPSQAL